MEETDRDRLTEQVGAILPGADGSGTTIVFLTNAIQLDSLNPLAQFLVETLAPSSSTIIASYHLASYIAPPAFTSRLPILFLAPTPPSSRADSAIESLRTDATIEPFSTPNLLHGLASSLVIVSSVASKCLPLFCRCRECFVDFAEHSVIHPKRS